MTGFFEGRGNPHTTVTPHELGEHQDITITTPVQGDTLQYEESTDTWVNRPIEGLGSGHIIQDEGVSFAQRLSLNFVGDGVEVLDDSPTNTTTVSIEQPLTTGIDELDVATSLDGTETGAFLKDGSGVSVATAQILGDPVRHARTHALDYLRGYTDFHRTTAAYSGTNGAQWGGEPWISRFSGTGAAVITAKLLGLRGVILTTGSDTNGYAAIEHMQSPNLFNFGYSMEATFKGGFNTAVLPTVEACTAQLGFVNTMTALATAGFYFEADENDTNWQAVVRANASNVTKVDTGVAYTTDYTKRWKLVFDATLDVLEYRFYINEALVATILEGTRMVPALTSLYMAAQIRKSAGTTAAGISFDHHSYKIQQAGLVGF